MVSLRDLVIDESLVPLHENTNHNAEWEWSQGSPVVVQQQQVRRLATVAALAAGACGLLIWAAAAVLPGAHGDARSSQYWWREAPTSEVYDMLAGGTPRGNQIRAMGNTRCLDWRDKALVKTPECRSGLEGQLWRFSESNFRQIRTLTGKCLDSGGAFVHYWTCAGPQETWGGNQKWTYNPTSKQIRTATGKCLEVNMDGGAVGQQTCQFRNLKQKWILEGNSVSPSSEVRSNVFATASASTNAGSAPPTAAPASQQAHKPHFWAHTTRKPATPTPAETGRSALVEDSAAFIPTMKPPTVAPSPALEVPAGNPAPAPALPPPAPPPPPPVEQDEEDDGAIQTAARSADAAAALVSVGHVQIRRPMDKKGGDLCVDAGGDKIHLWHCDATLKGQLWTRSKNTGQYKSVDSGKCLDKQGVSKALLNVCKDEEVALDSTQDWTWNRWSTQLMLSADSSECLHAEDGQGKMIEVKACDPHSNAQKWDVRPVLAEVEVAGSTVQILRIILIVAGSVSLLACAGIFLFTMFRKGPIKKAASPSRPAKRAIMDPRPILNTFQDPRPDIYRPRDISVVAFSLTGLEEPWDELCRAGFLGTFLDLGTDGLKLKGNGVEKSFTNAEAAFQALRFWDAADSFRSLDGAAARQHALELSGTNGQPKSSFAGYGSEWNAMEAVLKAKFRSGSRLERVLEKTGDSFLLAHCSEKVMDPIWTDNCDGEGRNMLGMQLMLLRDKRTGWKKWTQFIEGAVDFTTGEPLPPDGGQQNAWHEAVRKARDAIVDELARPTEDASSDMPLLSKYQRDSNSADFLSSEDTMSKIADQDNFPPLTPTSRSRDMLSSSNH